MNQKPLKIGMWLGVVGLVLSLLSTASPAATNEQIILTLEEPGSDSVYSGVGNIRGWAVAPQGIQRIELAIDGVYRTTIPSGGLRTDVGDAYPTYPNADASGFSMAYNYSNLAEGQHSIVVKAVATDGVSREMSVTFFVARFENPFITDPGGVHFSGATCSLGGSTIFLDNVVADNKAYNIRVDWRTAAQGLAFTQIIPINIGQQQEVLVGSQLFPGFDLGVNSSGNRTDWVSDEDGQIKMAYPAGQDWGAVFITAGAPNLKLTVDHSAFSTLSVEMRGDIGGEQLQVGIKSIDQPDDGSETMLPITLTTDWRMYTFSLNRFTGVDLTNLHVVAEFVFTGTNVRTVYVRSIKYVENDTAN